VTGKQIGRTTIQETTVVKNKKSGHSSNLGQRIRHERAQGQSEKLRPQAHLCLQKYRHTKKHTNRYTKKKIRRKGRVRLLETNQKHIQQGAFASRENTIKGRVRLVETNQKHIQQGAFAFRENTIKDSKKVIYKKGAFVLSKFTRNTYKHTKKDI
jgi:Cu2+-containing amine oxidase